MSRSRGHVTADKKAAISSGHVRRLLERLAAIEHRLNVSASNYPCALHRLDHRRTISVAQTVEWMHSILDEIEAILPRPRV